MIKLIIAICSIFFLLIPKEKINAVPTPLDFSISYDLTYNIDENGKTFVTKRGLLTNLTDKKYVSTIDINFDTDTIQDISSYDDFGPIEPNITTAGGKTKVQLTLNQTPLGIGQKTTFTLLYENPNITKLIGTIWVVTIPKGDESSEVVAYNVKVVPPQNFGKPSYAYPKPSNDLSWNKEQVIKDNIILAFGAYQSFDFKLNYQLVNNLPWFSLESITLPQDTLNSRVFITSLSNKPESISLKDAKKEAVFELFPFGRKTVEITGQVHVYPKENLKFWYSSKELLSSISFPTRNVLHQEIKVADKVVTEKMDLTVNKKEKEIELIAFIVSLVFFTLIGRWTLRKYLKSS